MANTPPITVCQPEAGMLQFGEEEGRALRKKHVQLCAGSQSQLRLFKDGGWELKSAPNEKGSNIVQKGEGPLNIMSEGDIRIEAGGKFYVSAQEIVMESMASDGDIILNATRNIRLDADNNVTILGTNTTVKASQTLLAHSDGMHILSGTPVTIHESMTPLLPGPVGDLVGSMLGNLSML